jgi:hypothetical protein
MQKIPFHFVWLDKEREACYYKDGKYLRVTILDPEFSSNYFDNLIFVRNENGWTMPAIQTSFPWLATLVISAIMNKEEELGSPS